MNGWQKEETVKSDIENKLFFNRFYKRERPGRRYFSEYEDFIKRIGDTHNKIIISIGNGRVRPFFENQIVSDISFEGIRRINSQKRCVFNAHMIPLRSESVDIVYGWQVVHHLDIDRFFPELYRVLKNGGKVVFVDNAYSPQWRLIRKLFRKNPSDPKEDLSEDYLRKKSIEYGFSDFRSERHNFFAYLYNRFMREIGIDSSLNLLIKLDSFCKKWKLFRDNLRNMVWSFSKKETNR